jgi:transposase
VLSKFRTRLTETEAESLLLDTLLERLQAGGWLNSGGRARTDSTHVLAAIRTLNRLENVGETLRAALNDLAVVAPDWLRQFACAEWVERYGKRVEQSRLPDNNQKRYADAEQIGADGLQLLRSIYEDPQYHWLDQLQSVETLRQTWVHQFYSDEEGQLRWRQPKDLPPPRLRTDSPDDPEVRYGNQGSVSWAGYKVHLTETCDPDDLHVMTHVETTEATPTEVMMTETIHQALVDKHLAPDPHLVDGGDVDAELLVESRHAFDIELVGPVRGDIAWPSRDEHAYDLSHVEIHWYANR